MDIDPDRWQRLLAAFRNAKGTPIDDRGMVVTKAPRGSAPIEPESLGWLVGWFMRHPQWRAPAPSTQSCWGNLLQRFLAEPWPASAARRLSPCIFCLAFHCADRAALKS